MLNEIFKNDNFSESAFVGVLEISIWVDWFWEYKRSGLVYASNDFPEESAIISESTADEAAFKDFGLAIGIPGVDRINE